MDIAQTVVNKLQQELAQATLRAVIAEAQLEAHLQAAAEEGGE